jgi:hypothetical protein
MMQSIGRRALTSTMRARGLATAVPVPSSSSSGYVYQKTTTGLVGLAVDPNARDNLIKFSKQVLDKAKVNI